MTYSLLHPFSTPDQDNDGWKSDSCAKKYGAGWWYNKCSESNLNGHYFQGGAFKDDRAGIEWTSWKGYEYSYKSTVMMLRPHYSRNYFD